VLACSIFTFPPVVLLRKPFLTLFLLTLYFKFRKNKMSAQPPLVFRVKLLACPTSLLGTLSVCPPTPATRISKQMPPAPSVQRLRVTAEKVFTCRAFLDAERDPRSCWASGSEGMFAEPCPPLAYFCPVELFLFPNAPWSRQKVDRQEKWSRTSGKLRAANAAVSFYNFDTDSPCA
jgi:hypothetical protein